MSLYFEQKGSKLYNFFMFLSAHSLVRLVTYSIRSHFLCLSFFGDILQCFYQMTTTVFSRTMGLILCVTMNNSNQKEPDE